MADTSQFQRTTDPNNLDAGSTADSEHSPGAATSIPFDQHQASRDDMASPFRSREDYDDSFGSHGFACRRLPDAQPIP